MIILNQSLWTGLIGVGVEVAKTDQIIRRGGDLIRGQCTPEAE